MMSLRIGIDIGSTTVKVVVLDEYGKLLFRSYERHYSRARERAGETLRSVGNMLSGKDVKLVVTGSAGLGWPGLPALISCRRFTRPPLP
jgi:activator of 2-hydroxyglutaryl-CoA dehydratase